MTLDEAIIHAEDVADKKEREKQKWERWLETDSDYRAVNEKVSCELCAEEHRQLAQWLKEYKRLKEQEPCNDAISRAQAIYVASGYCHPANVARELEKLPSVKPAEIKEPCEDCISRQAVIELAKKGVLISNRNYESVCKAINELPPVTPQPKSGYWIDKDIRGSIEPYCSSCGDSIDVTYHYNYCPNCGAKMVKPKESEEKMTNQEKFIQTFGIDAWKQMIVFSGLAEQFKEYWTSPYNEMNCRDCKEFEDCPCGKDGHESGTSQGYTIGECKDFVSRESEVKEAFEMCKIFPENTTNGEIIQILFPNIDRAFSNVIDLNLWWNAKYKKESEE